MFDSKLISLNTNTILCYYKILVFELYGQWIFHELGIDIAVDDVWIGLFAVKNYFYLEVSAHGRCYLVYHFSQKSNLAIMLMWYSCRVLLDIAQWMSQNKMFKIRRLVERLDFRVFFDLWIPKLLQYYFITYCISLRSH